MFNKIQQFFSKEFCFCLMWLTLILDMEGLQCQVEDKAIYLVGQYSHTYYAYWINLIDI